jgi:hypothetical protein
MVQLITLATFLRGIVDILQNPSDLEGPEKCVVVEPFTIGNQRRLSGELPKQAKIIC